LKISKTINDERGEFLTLMTLNDCAHIDAQPAGGQTSASVCDVTHTSRVVVVLVRTATLLGPFFVLPNGLRRIDCVNSKIVDQFRKRIHCPLCPNRRSKANGPLPAGSRSALHQKRKSFLERRSVAAAVAANGAKYLISMIDELQYSATCESLPGRVAASRPPAAVAEAAARELYL
jgi:hypothetical protein